MLQVSFRNVAKHGRFFSHFSPKVAQGVAAATKETRTEETLTDLFGRHHTYLRISLTEKCNLRCKYCMPEEGVQLTEKGKLLTTDEILRLSKLFVNEGVKKIRLTGGEPTIRKDLLHIVEHLKKIPGLDTIAMTTNGLVLTRNLVALQRAGLDIVNISLDSLKPERYQSITRHRGLERVMMGIDFALQLELEAVKVNCVVMKGFNDDEVVDFVNLTKDRNVDVRFIEYMPFTGNKWESSKMVPYHDLVKQIKVHFPDFHPLRNGPNDTSKAWKVEGHKGQVGFITSMSEHFCGSCNRLRLMADGSLKVCLFGNSEISLRDALRSQVSEEDLVALIGAAVRRKKKQHADKVNTVIPSNKSAISKPLTSQLSRFYSTSTEPKSESASGLSHVDNAGYKMVEVTDKPDTVRSATAQARVKLTYKLADLLKENATTKKGNVLDVAQLAGIMGAKRTPEIVPLCHNIPLSKIEVSVDLKYEQKEIAIKAKVVSTGKTGVEMEALTAVSCAALTVYDMCKAVSHDVIITDVQLLEKSGGRSGEYKRESFELRRVEGSPIQPGTVLVGNI